MSSLSKVNGVATFIMNYYDILLKNGYNIDFVLMHKGISDNKYLNKVSNNLGQVYYIPKHNILNRVTVTRKMMNNILIKKQYDVVHVNLIDLYAYACIKEAKIHNIEKIIYHIHNPKHIGKLLLISNILNSRCIKMATDLVACAQEAGKSMFGKNRFIVIKNAIDIEKYKFNNKVRQEYRNKFNIDDKFVIGTVGRLNEQKNPLFTLKVIREIKSYCNNVFLICIGNGKLKTKMQKYIAKNNLEENVLLIDKSNDIEKFYSAMDVFLLPSKYEGLGIVFIEAQCSGLKVYTSDNVPKEIEQTNLIDFISLKKNSKYWGNKIFYNAVLKEDRDKYNKIMTKSKYNISQNVNEIINLYKK